jgi:hypothetical protein
VYTTGRFFVSTTQLSLPGIDWQLTPKGRAFPRPRKHPAKPRNNRHMCVSCQGKLPPKRKPRPKMPLTHALETVQGVMIARLDAMAYDIAKIVGDEVREEVECEQAVLARIAGRIVNALNYRFFPEAYEDGEPYTPDPAGRMDDVPVQPLGLVPKRPTIAILAAHLLRGQQSAAAELALPDGQPLFTESDLARLGERQARRARV